MRAGFLFPGAREGSEGLRHRRSNSHHAAAGSYLHVPDDGLEEPPQRAALPLHHRLHLLRRRHQPLSRSSGAPCAELNAGTKRGEPATRCWRGRGGRSEPRSRFPPARGGRDTDRTCSGGGYWFPGESHVRGGGSMSSWRRRQRRAAGHREEQLCAERSAPLWISTEGTEPGSAPGGAWRRVRVAPPTAGEAFLLMKAKVGNVGLCQSS